MDLIKLHCTFCDEKFSRTNGRVNEARKFGWKSYCSLSCLQKIKSKQKEFQCSRPVCNNIFSRAPNDIRSKNLYCSRSCAASVNNVNFPKRKKSETQCVYCRKNFKGNQLYCSRNCKNKSQIINRGEIIEKIKEFYRKYERIPLKMEFFHYNAARDRFGNWNKAIIAAGFTPNPVLFSRKHIAKDGHTCDSFAEKIIDDWLFEKNIAHERNKKYPDNPKLTTDFVTEKYWIEFFGLIGELKEYDKVLRKKYKLAKKYDLPFKAVYPKDIFPINRLSEIIV